MHDPYFALDIIVCANQEKLTLPTANICNQENGIDSDKDSKKRFKWQLDYLPMWVCDNYYVGSEIFEGIGPPPPPPRHWAGGGGFGDQCPQVSKSHYVIPTTFERNLTHRQICLITLGRSIR